MTKQENYFDKYYPAAKRAGEKYKIDPLIILAQGAHESASGTSNIALKANNFFGITASGAKNIYWKGKTYQAINKYKLKFRVYDTPEDSFMDFARLIANRYKSAHLVANDYKAYATRISSSAYITEANGDNRVNYKNNIIKGYEQLLTILKKKSLVEYQLQVS